MVTVQADSVTLGLLVSPEKLGVYKVAQQVSEALSLIIYGISIGIVRNVVVLHTAGEKGALQQLVSSRHRVAFGLTAIVATVLFGGADVLLARVYGETFNTAVIPLRILLVSKTVYSALGLSGMVLAMTGFAWLSVRIATAGAVLSVLENLLLVGRFGIAGAALASGSVSVMVAAASVYQVKKCLGINILPWVRRHDGNKLS
jgi:O-antigen/teichoic acid export membrane protein